MSKIELVLSKLRSISVLVSIGTFAFFVITFAFAVINGKINFTTGVYDVGYETLLILFFIIFLGALVIARAIDLFLQREAKLMDVSEYRKSLKQKEEVSFSQTKIYSNIIKTKKSKYPEEAPSKGLNKTKKDIFDNNNFVETENLKDTITNKKIKETDQLVLYKSGLIEIVAKETNLSKVKAKLLINSTLSIITEQLKNENEVKIGKFGRFKKVFVKAKDETNPTNGKVIKVLEGYTVKFYADKIFKDMIALDTMQVSNNALQSNQSEIEEESQIKEKSVIDKKLEIEEKLETEDIPEKVVSRKPPKVKIVTKTKTDFIEIIASSGEISKNKSNKFLAAFSKVITEELVNDGEVELTGLGKMITIVMPAKDAVNPQTQQKIIVPSHKQVRFRFLKEFKNKFN